MCLKTSEHVIRLCMRNTLVFPLSANFTLFLLKNAKFSFYTIVQNHVWASVRKEYSICISVRISKFAYSNQLLLIKGPLYVGIMQYRDCQAMLDFQVQAVSDIEGTLIYLDVRILLCSRVFEYCQVPRKAILKPILISLFVLAS
ncbi:hypothetical protein FGO68_gene9041 [Halteria grandinella]|uniref:Uncharacterized protein n=1 Tax=Halteria grandinella TaxID=5974 RepID=A0A8J8NX87_HALGN|nr:hypothetical protein FGO68_gene9041 [Halteria grandinella]